MKLVSSHNYFLHTRKTLYSCCQLPGKFYFIIQKQLTVLYSIQQCFMTSLDSGQFCSFVADTDWGLVAQWLTFCQKQQQDLENVASSTPVQLPETLFHPTFMTLLIRVHSENDLRVYFLIVLITDYCWRSSTCRIAATYKSHTDW